MGGLAAAARHTDFHAGVPLCGPAQSRRRAVAGRAQLLGVQQDPHSRCVEVRPHASFRVGSHGLDRSCAESPRARRMLLCVKTTVVTCLCMEHMRLHTSHTLRLNLLQGCSGALCHVRRRRPSGFCAARGAPAGKQIADALVPLTETDREGGSWHIKPACAHPSEPGPAPGQSSASALLCPHRSRRAVCRRAVRCPIMLLQLKRNL